MNKTVLCTVGALVLTNAYAGDQVISFNKNLSLVPQSKHEQNAKSHYKLDVHYPQIESTVLNTQSKSFNQAMDRMVNEEIVEFKKRIIDNSATSRKLPKEVANNEFHMEYNATAFEVDKQTVISIKFNEEITMAGAAHPMHAIEVFNYNLTTGKEVRLADVFKTNSTYLDVFSQVSRKELMDKVQNDDSKTLVEGTAPQAENFKNWNLQANGVLITFNEYQVAPYVFGQPEIVIPYSALTNVLAPESPLGACAQTAGNCNSVG